MRMLSGRMHWLTMGLALLVSAQGFATNTSHAQAPLNPAAQAAMRKAGVQTASHMQGSPYGMPSVTPAGGMSMPDAPMSMAFEGPAPMEVLYGDSCDGGGCNACGGSACGGRGCGRGCLCGGVGCLACSGGDCGSLFSGRLAGLLGPLAPYSEGGRSSQRWFDLYAGTIGLRRTSDVGGFSNATIVNNLPLTFGTGDVISQQGGNPVLRASDLDLDKMRYGLELIAALQTGPGSNLEARYFGLVKAKDSRAIQSLNPDLQSVFSDFGTNPAGGFDDTDNSFIHGISYESELHNGEVNYRRRWVSPFAAIQGSWLGGLRYFDLDERFGFAAVGSFNNTFTADQLRFANIDTFTRNQLTGFQLGGDMWVSLIPGVMAGVEGKAGIFGNHAESETVVVANSVPLGREHIQDGKTAYLAEAVASVVYRLTYSWSFKASYNVLYIDNLALAPENFNSRDMTSLLGAGATGSFGLGRSPFINVDSEALYQGFSVGGEFLY